MVKLNSFRFGGSISVKYLKSRLIWYFAKVGIITAQNVMNSVGVCLSLQRINPPLRQALLVLPQPNRTNITYQLLSSHQLLIQHSLPLFLLTTITTTSFMSLDSDKASRCLKCSQLKS